MAKHARGDYDPTDDDEGMPVVFFCVSCALLAVAAAVSVAVLVGLVNGSGAVAAPSAHAGSSLVVSDRPSAEALQGDASEGSANDDAAGSDGESVSDSQA